MSLIQEIQQLGLPRENSEALASQYSEHKDLMRTTFAKDSYRVNKLVSTDWRVDNIISSNANESGLSLQLNVKYDSRPQDDKLNLGNESSRTQSLTLEMTPDDLNLLIFELGNATKLLENIGK